MMNIFSKKLNKIKYRGFLVFFVITGFPLMLLSQNPWASAVVDYAFGGGQTLGQDAPYFPSNVLGAVNPNVTNTTPASLPSEVVSLGRNGWLVLTFEQDVIDGQGADFTVFENAFEYAGGQVFDEWLIVSVSQDGENWITFPYDSITGIGFAGRTPTHGGSGINYQDIYQSGGDGFDLAEIGLNSIRFVKLQDATRFQTPEKIAAEVDAVIGIHLADPTTIPIATNLFSLSVENQTLLISSLETIAVLIVDISGRELFSGLISPGAAQSVFCNVPTGGIMYITGRNQKRTHYAKFLMQ